MSLFLRISESAGSAKCEDLIDESLDKADWIWSEVRGREMRDSPGPAEPWYHRRDTQEAGTGTEVLETDAESIRRGRRRGTRMSGLLSDSMGRKWR